MLDVQTSHYCALALSWEISVEKDAGVETMNASWLVVSHSLALLCLEEEQPLKWTLVKVFARGSYGQQAEGWSPRVFTLNVCYVPSGTLNQNNQFEDVVMLITNFCNHIIMR